MSFKDQDSKKSLGEQLHDVEFIIMDESGKTTGESALPLARHCCGSQHIIIYNADPDPGSFNHLGSIWIWIQKRSFKLEKSIVN